MSGEEKIQIEYIETKQIEMDKIQLNELQARQINVTKGLEIFSEQIRSVGLIQPIVVYKIGDNYELLVGQRRYYACKDFLKWERIRAEIIKKPKDSKMATTISWLENEARQKMSNKDMMRLVATMLADRTPKAEIAKTLGITQAKVDTCMGLPSVPDVVREAVEKNVITPEAAIRATIAKHFHKWETPESEGDDVLDLAKKMDQHGIKEGQAKNMADYSAENPEATNEEIIKDGPISTQETVAFDLSSSENKRLERYRKNNNLTSKGAAARDLVLDGLDQAGE